MYLGSTESADQPITTVMESWSGHEYLFSSAIYRYVEATGESLGGLRILAHLIGRIVPASIWPTVYEDLVRHLNIDIDLTRFAGIPAEKIANVVGWKVAEGSAPGFVGDFWLEFGIGAPLAIAVVGWVYGRFWRRARTVPAIQPVYILVAALSIYLITQGIDAWLFRCLLFAVPAWAAVEFLKGRKSARYRTAVRPPLGN
jgi:hypothetical protein